MPTCTPERAETHEKWWGCQEPLTPPSLAASEQIQRAVTSNSVYLFAKVPPLVRLAMIEISAEALIRIEQWCDTKPPPLPAHRSFILTLKDFWENVLDPSSFLLLFLHLTLILISISILLLLFFTIPPTHFHLPPDCAFHRFNALYWLIGSNECDVSPFSAHILTSS